jgi:hypothetical protein
LKPKFRAKLNDDLIILYMKLVDLGVGYRDGKVYLADLAAINSVPH